LKDADPVALLSGSAQWLGGGERPQPATPVLGHGRHAVDAGNAMTPNERRDRHRPSLMAHAEELNIGVLSRIDRHSKRAEDVGDALGKFVSNCESSRPVLGIVTWLETFEVVSLRKPTRCKGVDLDRHSGHRLLMSEPVLPSRLFGFGAQTVGEDHARRLSRCGEFAGNGLHFVVRLADRKVAERMRLTRNELDSAAGENCTAGGHPVTEHLLEGESHVGASHGRGLLDALEHPSSLRMTKRVLSAWSVPKAMAVALTGWLPWALLSACFAALTAIFAKVGLKGVDSDYATLIRTVVILVVLSLFVALAGKWSDPRGLAPQTWFFLGLSGLATGASWVCYFRALQIGEASKVAPVDKFSVVLVALFAVGFLRERPSLREWLGIGLVTAGVVVLALKR